MGFRAAKAAVVRALREGDYEHEARDALREKNLLAVGDVDAEEVARLVLRTPSNRYRESPHHEDVSVTVHTFRPLVDGEEWYVKAYFLEGEDGTATFISVHRSTREDR